MHEIEERESMLRLRQARLQKQRQEYLAATTSLTSSTSRISAAVDSVSDPYVMYKIKQAEAQRAALSPPPPPLHPSPPSARFVIDEETSRVPRASWRQRELEPIFL